LGDTAQGRALMAGLTDRVKKSAVVAQAAVEAAARR
jgi:hypothetical protein